MPLRLSRLVPAVLLAVAVTVLWRETRWHDDSFRTLFLPCVSFAVVQRFVPPPTLPPFPSLIQQLIRVACAHQLTSPSWFPLPPSCHTACLSVVLWRALARVGYRAPRFSTVVPEEVCASDTPQHPVSILRGSGSHSGKKVVWGVVDCSTECVCGCNIDHVGAASTCSGVSMGQGVCVCVSVVELCCPRHRSAFS